MFLFLIGISVPEYQQHILRRYGEKYYRNSGKGRKSFRNKCGVRIVQRIVKHRFNSSIPLQCFASGSLASYNFLSSLKHSIYWDACKGNVLSRLFVLFENYFLLIKRSCKICLHFLTKQMCQNCRQKLTKFLTFTMREAKRIEVPVLITTLPGFVIF